MVPNKLTVDSSKCMPFDTTRKKKSRDIPFVSVILDLDEISKQSTSRGTKADAFVETDVPVGLEIKVRHPPQGKPLPRGNRGPRGLARAPSCVADTPGYTESRME